MNTRALSFRSKCSPSAVYGMPFVFERRAHPMVDPLRCARRCRSVANFRRTPTCCPCEA
jgi:hypothetical protein